MTPEIELFQKTIDKLVGAFRARRPVTLQPSEKLADALESGGRIVKTEIDRRKNSGKLGGRPRKDSSEIKPSAVYQRQRRAKAKAI